MAFPYVAVASAALGMVVHCLGQQRQEQRKARNEAKKQQFKDQRSAALTESRSRIKRTT